MNDIKFYEVVKILTNTRTLGFEVDRKRGIVVGISEDGDNKLYAVLVEDSTYMLDGSDLAQTGEFVSRESLYDGSDVRVSPERYTRGDD
jgi:hypothetical protein